MILITDSTKEFNVLSDTYSVDKRYIFRVHAYKGRWAHTFPFDPSVGYNVIMDSDMYFQGIVAGKKVIFDLNFLSSFENIGLMLLDLELAKVKDCSINYNSHRFIKCCPDYLEKITDIEFIKKFAIAKRLINARIFLNKPWLKNIYHLNFASHFINDGLAKKITKILIDKKINDIEKNSSGIFWPLLDVCNDLLPILGNNHFNSYDKNLLSCDLIYNSSIFKNRISNIIQKMDLNFCINEPNDWYIDSCFDIRYLEQIDRFSLYKGSIIPSINDLFKCASMSDSSCSVYSFFNTKMNRYSELCRDIIYQSKTVPILCKKLWKIKI
jgi:hypothetical protein